MTALHVEMSKNAEGGELTQSLLHDACSYWIRRHPLLKAKIRRSLSDDRSGLFTNSSYFERSGGDLDNEWQEPTTEFKNVRLVVTSDAKEWRTLMESEMSDPLDTYGGERWL